jgi:hypothetical protein
VDPGAIGDFPASSAQAWLPMILRSIDQNADFAAQIGGMIESGELKAFQRGSGSFAQIVQRRMQTRDGHDVISNFNLTRI